MLQIFKTRWHTVTQITTLIHSSKLSEVDFKAFEQRLVSLAQAQDLIAKTQSDIVTLDELIRTAMHEVAGDQMARVELKGPEVSVSTDLVQPLAMVFHELTTNACKYGALGNAGKLTVTWSCLDKAVALEWRETGVALPTSRVGFGSKLIRSILRNQAMGKFTREFGPDGLVISLSFIA